jgi:hypothetical protein
MAVNQRARVVKEPPQEPLSEPMSFRHLQSRREMLETFMRADGHETLTPVLREAVDFYTAERIRRGRDAVRVTSAVAS